MKKNIHILHFKLDKESREKIEKLSKMNNKSISKTIVSFVEQLMPFIEKNHISFQDKKSRYQVINNKKEKRYSIHVYMTEEYYRKLKHIHHDLNIFSIAQIMRKLIEYYFKACGKYGVHNLLSGLENIKEKWNEKKNTFTKNKIKIMKQLYHKMNSPLSLIISYDIFSRPKIYEFNASQKSTCCACGNVIWAMP